MKKLYFLTGVFCITLLFFTLHSCETDEQRSERLAKKYCSSCHMFPDPSLLDKTTWQKSVLPDMRFRMGFPAFDKLSQVKVEDQSIVLKTLPQQAIISEEEWTVIQKYYLNAAPDSLVLPEAFAADTLRQFSVTELILPGKEIPSNSLLTVDTLNHKIYLSNRQAWLYKMNTDFVIEDSIRLKSPVSHIIPFPDQDPWVIEMGIMDPSDQSLGKISSVNFADHTSETLISSLKRPVFAQHTDLDNDSLEDFVVCAFGNYTGELIAFRNNGHGYEKNVLSSFPGARKVMIRDVDGNGFPDIIALMTQGDEQIILLANQGNFNFKITSLLRFPPVYGSSFFDIADFNGDGKFDILYTNGDNADLSMIFKPYHSVKIFTNDGSNHFQESWSQPFYGASQALARDFDMDGDVDIAAISFFPDFDNSPERGFMYFENAGKTFKPYITPLASTGRWLLIDAADIDEDGDTDILLGALDFDPGVPRPLYQRWLKTRTSMLILKNNQR